MLLHLLKKTHLSKSTRTDLWVMLSPQGREKLGHMFRASIGLWLYPGMGLPLISAYHGKTSSRGLFEEHV
jgi:hypothetical protein